MERWGETGELTVPLIAKDRVIGVLELLEHRGALSLSQDEIDTIFAVSRVAALAVENADLVDDLQLRNRETALLNDLARATGTSLVLQDIAAGALEKLRAFAPFERAFIGLLRDGDKLEVAFASEGRAQPLPAVVDLPPHGALLERLEAEGIVTLSLPADLPDGFVLPGLDDLATAILVILSSAGTAMGILALGSAHPGAFDAVDRRLLERVGAHLSLAVHNAELYSGIKRMHLSNLKALSSALNAKDYYTLGHAARVAAYMVLLGRELGWEPDLVRSVEEAAYLHDIGKIGVSDRVLLKPGGLNAHEWELMRQHPVFSADIIRTLFDEGLVAGVRHHHERWDGSGYPDGLAGEGIPLVARAMCVADSYDAMSFRRPYRQGLSYGECLAELERCAGSQFDPAMVAAFVRVLERMEEARRAAKVVATEAAARIDPARHALLRSREDEARPEFAEIGATLRAVCEEHPPARYAMTSMRAGKRTRHRLRLRSAVARQAPHRRRDGRGRQAAGGLRRPRDGRQRALRRPMGRLDHGDLPASRRRRPCDRGGHRADPGGGGRRRYRGTQQQRDADSRGAHDVGGADRPRRGGGDHRRPHGPLQPSLLPRAPARRARPLRRSGRPPGAAVLRSRRLPRLQRAARAQRRR